MAYSTVILLLIPFLVYSEDDYWTERAKILLTEEKMMLGGDLKFQYKERLANLVIMDAKHKEIEEGRYRVLLDEEFFLAMLGRSGYFWNRCYVV